MMHNRRFLAVVARMLILTVTMGFIGLASGCSETPPPEAGNDKAKDQQIQDKMKEFMQSKKGGTKK